MFGYPGATEPMTGPAYSINHDYKYINRALHSHSYHSTWYYLFLVNRSLGEQNPSYCRNPALYGCEVNSQQSTVNDQGMSWRNPNPTIRGSN